MPWTGDRKIRESLILCSVPFMWISHWASDPLMLCCVSSHKSNVSNQAVVVSLFK